MTDNTKLSKNYCVILAGGKGRRLWPCSREERPKQFIDFFGTGRTQLQQTYDRMLKVIPEENILVEPIHRNTAPSVAWACHRAQYLCPEANIIVTPSDQAVFKEENFEQNILEGMDFVDQHEGILIMGVRPTRPEPGYGYIQIAQKEGENLYKVKTFTEKPELELAKVFVASGEFYWNSGLFIWNVNSIIKALEKHLPDVTNKLASDTYGTPKETDFINERFSTCNNVSIDFGVMEKADNVYVSLGDFGWSDLGTWGSLYDLSEKDDEGNVTLKCHTQLYDSKNNIVVLPSGKLAVIAGMEGYLIAESDNVLLICPKDQESAIRKYVNDAQIRFGNDFI